MNTKQCKRIPWLNGTDRSNQRKIAIHITQSGNYFGNRNLFDRKSICKYWSSAHNKQKHLAQTKHKKMGWFPFHFEGDRIRFKSVYWFYNFILGFIKRFILENKMLPRAVKRIKISEQTLNKRENTQLNYSEHKEK